METFLGSGNIPYAAIRESYVKAREFLRNYGTYFEPRQDPLKSGNLLRFGSLFVSLS